MSMIISGIDSHPQQIHGAAGVKEPPQVQPLEAEAPVRSRAPVMDAYIPEKKGPEQCTANTDQVDREIERLKKQKEALERQIDVQTDDVKIKELERKLDQVERELAQKDNDTYRRQHAVFS